jgi:hypothetical protein
MLLAVRVNFEHFLRDVMAGDPVVWLIILGVAGFSAFSFYKKCLASSQKATEAK